MIPINKINDPDKVLPQKQYNLNYPPVDLDNENANSFLRGHNDIVDQYNSISIDGDVEELAKMMFMSANCVTERDWNALRATTRESWRKPASLIIANLDKFLVVRKG